MDQSLFAVAHFIVKAVARGVKSLKARITAKEKGPSATKEERR
jgi:hypothetical protein